MSEAIKKKLLLTKIFREVFQLADKDFSVEEIECAEFGKLQNWDSVNHLHFVIEVERVFGLPKNYRHLLLFASYRATLDYILNDRE